MDVPSIDDNPGKIAVINSPIWVINCSVFYFTCTFMVGIGHHPILYIRCHRFSPKYFSPSGLTCKSMLFIFITHDQSLYPVSSILNDLVVSSWGEKYCVYWNVQLERERRLWVEHWELLGNECWWPLFISPGLSCHTARLGWDKVAHRQKRKCT